MTEHLLDERLLATPLSTVSGVSRVHATKLGMGEHQIAFVLHPNVRLSIESTMRVTSPTGETTRVDDYLGIGRRPASAHQPCVVGASRTPSGALRMEWSNGTALKVDDDSDQFESYRSSCPIA